MNRAERRRQEKREAKKGPVESSFAIHTLLEEAKAHHQAGRLPEAERGYQMILGMRPDHSEALHLLGLTAYRAGRFEQAIDRLAKAVQVAPRNPLYWFNLGVVAQKAGRLDEAAEAYRQAISLDHRQVQALTNLGNLVKDQGDLVQAGGLYRRALSVDPHYVEAHNNLGVTLKEQGRLEDAVAAYRQAIAIKPNHVEAHNNLGLVFMELGRWDEAVAAFEHALQIMPGYVKATYNLGIVSIWKGQFDRALACMQQSAEAKHHHGRPLSETAVYQSRLKHDAEQIQYLLDRGRLGREFETYRDALQRLRQQVEAQGGSTNRVEIDPGEIQSVAPSFQRMVHRAAAERVATGALSPKLDVSAIEARYYARRPEATHIDDLLNDETLESLRRFCWESTIWKKDYENGYVGAFLGDGFASPLLLQIAEELRLKFPNIFKSHRLTQAWAFKHDSARRGLNIHADAAAVNVNFWITSDDANLDPASGGLVVWDKEAPREWNFKDYNSDRNRQKIYEWLQEQGAQAIRIPYRANRAVVFNSDLFHETDHISFKDEYLSRRINMTLLYGHRLKA